MKQGGAPMPERIAVIGNADDGKSLWLRSWETCSTSLSITSIIFSDDCSSLALATLY
ncbi:hypothetical protein KDI_35030 [Dictyobacter arantiisoli]|uniref:Uncharacterized protein n=1 Tax=Dictyobacter arantiisoli TaxID=2014874 RepID=A0A5A5TG12_9CHLR|nr:hypothetical protein KDI_35030 [Dictyobacter arantiisoli]